MENLKNAGCLTVYLNGSFVTNKEVPNDFDACWEEDGVDPAVLDPVLLTFDPAGLPRRRNTWGSCSRPLQSQAETGSHSWSSSKQIKKREHEKELSP